MLPLIMALANEADKDKMEQIYNKYRGIMHYTARGILKEHSLADDAVSESFVKLIRNIDKIGDVSSPKTRSFIITVVRNTAYNIFNKELNSGVDSEFAIEISADSSSPIHDRVVSMESYNHIVSLVDALPSSQRDILVLSLFHGLSYSEIADITGLNYEVVKKRVHRAKATIKEQLEKNLER